MVEGFLKTVVDSIGDGIVVADANGRFLYFNRAAERILGRGAEDVPSEQWQQTYGVFLPDGITPFPENQMPLLRALAGTETDGVEQLVRNPDVPEGVLISITGRPVVDESGALQGAVVVFRDITKSRQLSAEELARANAELSRSVAELAKANAELAAEVEQRRRAESALDVTQVQLQQSQKMEAIGRLAGGIAHDFNNVLSVILSHSQILVEDLPIGSELHVDAAQIHTAAERAKRLTQQLLAFSRRQVLRPAPIDLSSVVRDLEPMLARLVGEDIELASRLELAVDPILADRGQIEQIVMNLVVNSRDAMPKGGRLVLSTANVRLDERYSESHAEVTPGPYVLLDVTDSGSGIDPETQERIFEPFFTTKERGTGLGLATVYGVVKQSGGHVWVYSEVGRGTTFKIYFPRHGAPPAARPASLGPAAGGAGERILVIEDEPLVRRAVCTILRRAGYDVLEAGTSGDAEKLVLEHGTSIRLLLVDVILADRTGPEVVRELIPSCPNARAVYTSGYNEEHVLAQGALEPGAHFLQKPVTPEALLSTVKKLLAG